MDLQRTYYPFPVQQGIELVVHVTGGDDVEYGPDELPFTADGSLSAGQERQFDESFVLHFPGASSFEVNVAPTEAEAPQQDAMSVPVPDDSEPLPPLPPDVEATGEVES